MINVSRIEFNMVKVIGIDPGTKSFDLCGLNNGEVFLEKSIPSNEVSENPRLIIDILKSSGDLDMIIGPSGYGVPITHINKLGDKENFELTLVKPDDNKKGGLGGLSKLVKMMITENLNVYFIPGVIHLKTVPEHRKVNKIDMGTADKLCCATLGIYDQSKRLNIDYDETTFIMVEMGYSFNAILGVEKGKIVDGIGGTLAGPAFKSQGKLDGELAYLLSTFSKDTLFEGGISSIIGNPNITPEEFVRNHTDSEKYDIAWKALIEGIERDVASIKISVKKPREILISGRLATLPGIYDELSKRLAIYGNVEKVQGFTKNVKESAQGAALIADGLAGGKYKKLVRVLNINEASGSVLDHIYLSNINGIKKKYGLI